MNSPSQWYGGESIRCIQRRVRARGSPLRNPGDIRREARRWAQQALKLDDTLAEAHNALARAAQQEWDWAGAEREYRRAIDLNANYSLARIWYSMFLNGMQRFDEAIQAYQIAIDAEPDCSDAYYNLAHIYEQLGKRALALRYLKTYKKLTER